MIDRDSLSPAIRLLFDRAVELDSSKIDVTIKALAEAEPNHSKRDYVKAIDTFKDFKAELENHSLPMPIELKSWFDRGIQGLWAKGCSWFNDQKSLIESSAEERIASARKDRDEVNERCEHLLSHIESLKIELNNEKELNLQLNQALKGCKDELQKCQTERVMLTTQVAELRSAVNVLRDSICSKIQKMADKV
ncbi:MAG: hypothetical protein ACI4M9_09045 [Succinivibrio sp.]